MDFFINQVTQLLWKWNGDDLHAFHVWNGTHSQLDGVLVSALVEAGLQVHIFEMGSACELVEAFQGNISMEFIHA